MLFFLNVLQLKNHLKFAVSFCFSNGSIITDYILVLPVVLIVTPETRQDVIELPTKLQEMVLPIVDKIFTAIVNDTKAPTFLQAIDVTTATEIEVIPGQSRLSAFHCRDKNCFLSLFFPQNYNVFLAA